MVEAKFCTTCANFRMNLGSQVPKLLVGSELNLFIFNNINGWTIPNVTKKTFDVKCDYLNVLYSMVTGFGTKKANKLYNKYPNIRSLLTKYDENHIDICSVSLNLDARVRIVAPIRGVAVG